jgi:hypothetical protein
MEFSGSIRYVYTGFSNREEILDKARTDWRAFTGDDEIDLPWNTSIDVYPNTSGDSVAEVTVRWERAT